MKRSTVILSACLLIVLTYAVGLTYGIGPRKVATKFNERVLTPTIARVFGPHSVLDDYVEKPCPTENVVSIAYFGQSNATNTVEPSASESFPPNLLQYDWKSQKCFAYQEPLLGADFTRGNNITYAAIELAKHSTKTVVIIPFGFGPSSVLEWAYGRGATQESVVIKRLKESGLSPQVFLWHQGESDVPLDNADEYIMAKVPYFQRPDKPLDKGLYRYGITKDAYKDAMTAIVHRTLEAFPNSYFGIALVSVAPCMGRHQSWEPMREAQVEVAQADSRAFISADSDSIIGIENRYDTCHFSAEGARKLSEQYFRSISALNVL